MHKKIIYIFMICLLLTQNVFKVRAASAFNIVSVNENGTYDVIKEEKTYNDAYAFYNEFKDSYNNLGILKDDKFIYINSGVVAFNNSNCSITTNYTNALNNDSGYTNACYGVDALFLGVNASQTKVKFQLSGVIGWANMSDLIILPFENMSNVTSYIVNDKGDLIHQIKTNINSDKFATLINNGIALTSLEKDKTYYSYDGHYFYDDFKLLSNDLKNNHHNNAINNTSPYYNYYQYITHRTISSYKPSEINNYINNSLGIKSSIKQYYDNNSDYIFDILTQSQLKDSGNAFIEYQFSYGANALMMLSLSMNEAASGRSALSYTRNNLFGHAAYDSSVEANASRYASINSTIQTHAKLYISNTYANPSKWQYHGSFFGNKGSGMNVSYASDPYWGEKAAQYYMRIDRKMGSKDYNAYTIGIKEDINSVKVYTKPTTTAKVIYESGKNSAFSFIILDEETINNTPWYKVQLDPAIKPDFALTNNFKSNDVYDYNYEDLIGYIPNSYIDTLISKKSNSNPTYINSTYKAMEGKFSNGASVLNCIQTSDEVSIAQVPIKENAIFDKWVLVSPGIYNASYIDIKDAYILGDYKKVYEINTYLNFNDMSLVLIDNKDHKTNIPVNSSMVSKIKLDKEGNNIIRVSYQGISKEISVFAGLVDTSYTDRIQSNLETIATSQVPLNKEQVIKANYLISELKENKIGLNSTTIRSLDALIKDATNNKLQVIINKNKLNLSVSGLSIYLDYLDIMKDFLPDVLNFHVNTPSNEANALIFQIAAGNEWNIYDMFNISGSFKKEPLDFSHNYTLSIPKPTFDNLSQMYIILAYKDNEIYRLYAHQSDNYITFNTNGFDTFGIAYLDTNNNYSDIDIMEVNTPSNNGSDFAKLFFYGAIGGFLLIIFVLTGLVLYADNKQRKLSKKRKATKIMAKHKQNFEPIDLEPDPSDTLDKQQGSKRSDDNYK